MAEITKRALAASLKKLVGRMPLDKVTVTDIAEDCGVNRQTFYYHFHDICDLVEWIYTKEASRLLEGKTTGETWQQGMQQIFNYLGENRTFVTATYRSAWLGELSRYLDREVKRLLSGVWMEKAGQALVNPADRDFILCFYTHALTGLVLEWVEDGMPDPKAALASRLEILLPGAFDVALDRFRTDR